MDALAYFLNLFILLIADELEFYLS